jgi:hypothetical protein
MLGSRQGKPAHTETRAIAGIRGHRRDLGELDRYAFHKHMKVYIAAPPDVLRIDEKNIRVLS